MREKLNQYITENKLVTPSDSLILAVSGGVDSMVMAHLFLDSGYRIAIVHCNFNLRGKESDDDQEFVRQFCADRGVKFFTIGFQTKAYAREKNISIQMAARDLRYSWFYKLAEELNYSHIAVAHNRDDLVETFLINLTRGTGIHGLTGIKPKTDRIIRPILFAERAEILEFAQRENITYREDSSNQETKYLRNKIRHKIIPLFKSLNPSFTDTIVRETTIFQAIENLYKEKLDEIKNRITETRDNEIRLKINRIKQEKITMPVLFDILECYGFSYGTVSDIWQSLDAEPGKIFFTDRYIAVKDRSHLVIQKTKDTEKQNFFIPEETTGIEQPVSMQLSRISNSSSFKIIRKPAVATLDYEKLEFPLQLRHWENGDYFYPLGLKGKKKLSDFFVDRKINRLDKEKLWLLVSGNNIVWVIGHQIDDRYKITPSTGKILQIELLERT